MNSRRRVTRTAFTLVELLVVIAIIALLVSILLPALAKARAAGRLSVCESNMKQFGIGYLSYGADYDDRIATFTWKPGVRYSPVLSAAADPIQAAADQAVDIVNRRADMTLPRITQWMPAPAYSHLVMNDYLAQRLPEPMVVCPEDRVRLRWQKDAGHFSFDFLGPGRPLDDAVIQIIPFSSSYQLVPAGYSEDRGGPAGPTVQQGAYHRQYQAGTLPLGNRRLSQVNFPAEKVAMFDPMQRHFGRDQFYAYDDSREPLLFWDGSVSVKRTGDSNPGFRPNDPTSGLPTRMRYAPDLSFEPPTRSGDPYDIVVGHYQWTRGGLHGVDFGGGEVGTSVP